MGASRAGRGEGGGIGMSESELAKEAKERRARRREWDPEREEERLDHRAVRDARFKKERVHVYLTPEGRAMLKAGAAKMNLGGGMSEVAYTSTRTRIVGGVGIVSSGGVKEGHV